MGKEKGDAAADAERARTEMRSALRESVVKITECETVSAANDLLRQGNHIIITIAFSGNWTEQWVKPTIIVGEIGGDAPICISDGR
jgi:hypothetical protein